MLSISTKKLGFGLMRLPKINGEEDIEQTKKMVDYCISYGYNYFDTAYVYDNGLSEKAVKEVLTNRYNRSDFILASKLPYWEVETLEDRERILQEQLERTGVEFFDMYLIHSITKGRVEHIDKLDAWNYAISLKERGIAKNIGFSFHDKAELLDELLTKHPEMEFVQLQINYADYDDETIQSKKCLEVCIKHNKPVIIMEPIKGGSLAVLNESTAKILKDANPNATLSSWALRFVAGLPNIVTILSGMSNLEQVQENVQLFENMTPLTTEEENTLDKAVQSIRSLPIVPCTSCGYCKKGCPKNIPIPAIFSCYNEYIQYNNLRSAKTQYSWCTEDGYIAGHCINCKQCESVCPQHIEITKHLKDISKLFD